MMDRRDEEEEEKKKKERRKGLHSREKQMVGEEKEWIEFALLVCFILLILERHTRLQGIRSKC